MLLAAPKYQIYLPFPYPHSVIPFLNILFFTRDDFALDLKWYSNFVGRSFLDDKVGFAYFFFRLRQIDEQPAFLFR